MSVVSPIIRVGDSGQSISPSELRRYRRKRYGCFGGRTVCRLVKTAQQDQEKGDEGPRRRKQMTADRRSSVAMQDKNTFTEEVKTYRIWLNEAELV